MGVGWLYVEVCGNLIQLFMETVVSRKATEVFDRSEVNLIVGCRLLR